MAKSGAFIQLDFSPQEEATMEQSAQAFYQQMAKRRSVRDFSDRPIPQSVLENAILAAGSAPSGANASSHSSEARFSYSSRSSISAASRIFFLIAGNCTSLDRYLS